MYLFRALVAHLMTRFRAWVRRNIIDDYENLWPNDEQKLVREVEAYLVDVSQGGLS